MESSNKITVSTAMSSQQANQKRMSERQFFNSKLTGEQCVAGIQTAFDGPSVSHRFQPPEKFHSDSKHSESEESDQSPVKVEEIK